MPPVAGRGPEPRTVSGVGTTATSTAITAPAGSFHQRDVGRTIAGPGIPAGTTISAVASSTAATVSAAATAMGTITATLGVAPASRHGFVGWAPETDAESESYSIAGGASATSPGRLTGPNQTVEQRSRA
jgi:hypothetical protein